MANAACARHAVVALKRRELFANVDEQQRPETVKSKKITRTQQGSSATGARSLVDAARASYARRAWEAAFRELREADQQSSLGLADLEKLTWSAGMLDRDSDLLPAMERLYQTNLESGQNDRAAYWAFFLGFRLLAISEFGRATAWLQRAQRLADQLGADCVVHGYLLLPGTQKSLQQGDLAAAQAMAAEAIAVGERCGEADLVAFARCQLGRAITRQGGVAKGIAQLDEAMLAATARELSPVITGLVYCSVIATCREVFAFERAREWTEALSDWCNGQPQLVQFNGLCRIHRAELMELNGAWPEAIDEVRSAAQRVARAIEQSTKAAAAYQEAEIHRLRGEFAAAEEAYKLASALGREPQPGLALLRLAQERIEQAAAAIRRCLAAVTAPLERARLLPSAVEILIAARDIAAARTASTELGEIARRFTTEVFGAMAAHACGTVELAEGHPTAALPHLRAAITTWQQVDAPYLAARVREQVALACRALGDEEGAQLEFDAAGECFERLGAAPDVARLKNERLLPGAPSKRSPLTAREIEVLRFVSQGRTNRLIAEALSLSEKTVDRHLSNIFDKLGVSSRAAATAYAIQNNLL